MDKSLNTKTKTIKILFVCTGNICRSPSAEGQFRQILVDRGLEDRFEIDSAGVSAYHVGEHPDPRSMAEARRHGVDLSYIRSRKIRKSDFIDFDFILAMDYGHYADLKAMAGSNLAHKVQLFLELIRDEERCSEVPDPYYGGPRGFENVFSLIQRGCESWIQRLISES